MLKMLVVARCHLRFDTAQFSFISLRRTLKTLLGVQLPVKEHEDNTDDHGPTGQLVRWDGEQDRAANSLTPRQLLHLRGLIAYDAVVWTRNKKSGLNVLYSVLMKF